MSDHVKPIPKGYRSVTPHLIVSDATRALEFYRRALGAREISRMEGSHGKIDRAEIKIGNSIVILSDEMLDGCRSPQSLGGSTINISLYVKDVDSAFDQAVSCGAEVKMPVTDMFWGDRLGQFIDPFGHFWSIATHQEDVAPEQIRKRAQAVKRLKQFAAELEGKIGKGHA